jgi:hypothetical protein
VTRELPILMYQSCSASRLQPYAGYRSLTFEEWRHAVVTRLLYSRPRRDSYLRRRLSRFSDLRLAHSPTLRFYRNRFSGYRTGREL